MDYTALYSKMGEIGIEMGPIGALTQQVDLISRPVPAHPCAPRHVPASVDGVRRPGTIVAE